jgi:hypothetical protein
LSLKIKVYSLSVVWPQNHYDSFLRFGFKTDVDGFSGLDLKPVAGFLVELQNQCGEGFPDLGLKIGSYSLMI